MKGDVTICGDLQAELPVFLCATPQGKLYTCTVGVKDRQPVEENICYITKSDAMVFVAKVARKAIKSIEATC